MKATLQGRLGNDPEVKTTRNGASYTTFRLAEKDSRNRDEAGNPITRWYTVTVWDSAMQNFCKTLHKGSAVEVSGYYEDRPYTSQKTGLPEIGRDINARMIDFCIGADQKRDDQQQQKPETPKAPTAKPEAPQAPQAPQPQAEGDDDLPF